MLSACSKRVSCEGSMAPRILLRLGKRQRKLAFPMNDPVGGSQAANPPSVGKNEWVRTLGRASRYLAIRFVVILLTVLVGVYAAIWVTNLGGYGDAQRKAEIEYELRFGINSSGLFSPLLPEISRLSQEERDALFQQAFEAAFQAADLDQPFYIRSFRYFLDAFTLSLGESRWMMSRAVGSHKVLDILLEKLPLTLLLFGFASLITFFGGLFIALALSRKYGSFLDRVVTLLIPIFAAPPWFHGIFLIVIFASFAKILPYGGIVDVPLPTTELGYVLSVLKHMILPVMACVLGTLPFAVYANRSLFMIHSTEDYVEQARAKGLQSGRLQRRYILRPVLPPIITNFAFVSLVAWQGIVITEHVFNWPGLGSLLIRAIQGHEVSVVIGAVTLFGYLLGLSIFFLDVLYVIVDPRVTLGVGGRN